jgi:cephalosporin hydroxylase
MKIVIDQDEQVFLYTINGETNRLHLYSAEAFALLNELQIKVGWQLRYPYTASWFGFQLLQIPPDAMRIQEIIYQLHPEIIVETGVAHGGSAIFMASLCKLIGVGHVIGVEKGLICRKQIESHKLSEYITLVEGDSVSRETVDHVYRLCRRTDRILLILDSCHSKAHVLAELEAYHDLIRPGLMIIVQDGNMQTLADTPRGDPSWIHDNPQEAVKEFIERHPEFVIEQPKLLFDNEGITSNITYHTNGFLRRTS